MGGVGCGARRRLLRPAGGAGEPHRGRLELQKRAHMLPGVALHGEGSLARWAGRRGQRGNKQGEAPTSCSAAAAASAPISSATSFALSKACCASELRFPHSDIACPCCCQTARRALLAGCQSRPGAALLAELFQMGTERAVEQHRCPFHLSLCNNPAATTETQPLPGIGCCSRSMCQQRAAPALVHYVLGLGQYCTLAGAAASGMPASRAVKTGHRPACVTGTQSLLTHARTAQQAPRSHR